MRPAALLATAIALSCAAPALAQTSATPGIEAVLAADIRADDRARDQYRHPAETLAFFEVEPGMRVVDFMPSGGWYSRVLIPYLGEEGTYIGLNPDVGTEGGPGFFDRMRDTANRFPTQAQGWVGDSGARVLGANVGDEAIDAMAGTVDRVLIFREMHNIRRFGWFHDLAVASRTLLKDDGMLGVVQHRASADAPSSYVLGDNGYQREEDVIALFSAYGFELVGKSEANANPADPADWEGGVWSLPPSFGGAPEGSEERARRAAIGESDRMTLLFRKRP
ncbi:class I SAM-dependent methyltransferase [Aurantiacibacter flavus]|uniref:Methyltransferase n=1 Tax=Aurantiacibacter flavus TaxID=3145232 RepID=A0ABV0CY07_9SPHN